MDNFQNDLFLRSCKCLPVERTPIWIMRQAGRYLPEYRAVREKADFLTVCKTPELAAEVTVQPIDLIGVDAAIIFSDILVIPDAMGVDVSFVEGVGPVLKPIDDYSSLSVDSVTEHLEPVYETLRRVVTALPKSCTLIGFAGAPWTLATYMIEGGTSRDFSTIKRQALSEPDNFSSLLMLLVEAVAEHLMAQVKAGAEVLQIFDSWGGAGSAAAFVRFRLASGAGVPARL